MTSEQLLSRITMDSGICHGKPCICCLRYPVEFLLELLSGDMTTEQILADYPDLEADNLRAAIAYAARVSRVKSIEPVAASNLLWTPNCRAVWRWSWAGLDTRRAYSGFSSGQSHTGQRHSGRGRP